MEWMDWIYILLLIVGFGFFLARITSSYLAQSTVLRPQIEQTELEKKRYETQAAEHEQNIAEIQEKLQELQQQIETLEKQRTELRQKLTQQREASQRKGLSRSR